MAKIFMEAYGCSASFADSEMIAGVASNGGHLMVDSPSEADLNIIVTCSVKDATANRMIHRIKSLSKKPLVVAGCLPKAERGTVKRFADRASMMGPSSIGRTLQVIDATLSGRRVEALEDTDITKVGLPKVRLNPAVGIIEIASGCLSECTFCQTKLAKGDLKSYRVGDIVRQIRHDVADGCKEVWLTSTDNGCYGLDIGSSLPELVGAACGIAGEFRIRIGMMNPMYMPRISEQLIKAYDDPKVYKFLHIPVQSGSRRILHEMKRGHTAGTFLDMVKRVRQRFEDFTISTDIIVGFPSETEEEFEETISLIKESRPDVVNLSKYSPRPGTEAAKRNQIGAAEVKRRSKKVFDLAGRISRENNQRWIGWEGSVLFNESTDGGIKGRNAAYKPVYVRDSVSVGEIHTVRIDEVTPNVLLGRLVGQN